MRPQPERHSTRAAAALRAVAEEDPAIAALSLWCVHRDGAETGTQGDVITYGADFEALPPHEQRGLAAHHVLHVALRHPARLADLRARLGDGFDPVLYNLAADAVVNEAVLLADHAVPRPAVTLTELVARALGTRLAPEAALAEWDVDRLYFALQARGDDQGRAQEAAQSYAQEQGFSEDMSPEPGALEAEQDATQAARWRQQIVRAMDAGRQAGRGIGMFGHRLADVPKPRVPWEVVLRRLLSAALMVGPVPNPRRPARRWIAAAAEAQRREDPPPGFQPGQRPIRDIPRLAVGLDASSSIDDARLALFWSEVTGIANRLQVELHLMVFDDAIQMQHKYIPGRSLAALPDLPRGGGTAFPPVIAEAQRLRVAALVMLTDLEGDAGPVPRGLDVIWVVPDAGNATPPFGRLIDMTGWPL